jgi:TPR repeat protein
VRKLTLSALAATVLLTGCATPFGHSPDPLVLAEQNRLLTVAHTADQSGNVVGKKAALEQAETIGNAEAATELGKMYIQGKGVAVDRDKAFQHFSEGAKLGSAEAQITAGWFNMYGVGTVKDEKAGIDLMKQAAKTDKRAKREMGLFYGNLRYPFLNDDSKGLKYLSESADEGDADGAYYLSVLATRMDKPKVAEEALNKASEMGQPKAQLQIGRAELKAGKYMQARDLFLKSAKSNDSEAMFELGKGLDEGKFPATSSTAGVTSTMESYAWLLGATSQKHLQAQELLSVVEKKLPHDEASKITLGNLIGELQGQVKPWDSK